MSQRARLLPGIFAVLCASVIGCTTSDAQQQPGPGSPGGGKADGDSLGATSHCELLYYSDACDGGVCSTVEVARFDQAIDAGDYPSFAQVLDGESFTGTAAANPAAMSDGTMSHIDGYYDLGIRDSAGTTLQISSEAGISMSTVARTGFVNAGDLRAKVAPFSYQDQTYNNLELLCYITGD